MSARNGRDTRLRQRVVPALLGIVAASLVWAGGAIASPSATALQLHPPPNLPYGLNETQVGQAAVLAQFPDPRIEQAVRDGRLDVAGRVWDNGGTMAIVELVFATDVSGASKSVVDGVESDLGPAAERSGDVTFWRNVRSSADPSIAADAALIARGSNVVAYFVVPSGALPDATLREIAFTQQAFMPDSSESARSPEAFGAALGRLPVALILLSATLAVAGFGLKVAGRFLRGM